MEPGPGGGVGGTGVMTEETSPGGQEAGATAPATPVGVGSAYGVRSCDHTTEEVARPLRITSSMGLAGCAMPRRDE